MTTKDGAMGRVRLSRILLCASLAAALSASFAEAQPAAPPKRECFASRDWNGWKASPDAKSIYIRVGRDKLYRIDLASACPALRGIGVHLVTRIHGSPWICHPLDLDLKVSDGHGFKTPCIVSDITRLSPEAAAALPKDLRP